MAFDRLLHQRHAVIEQVHLDDPRYAVVVYVLEDSHLLERISERDLVVIWDSFAQVLVLSDPTRYLVVRDLGG